MSAQLVTFWRSRTLTLVFAALYVGWLAFGWFLSVRRLSDPDSTTPVASTPLHRMHEKVTVRGPAVLSSLPVNEQTPWYRHRAAIHVHLDGGGPRILEFKLECRDATVQDTLAITDAATGRTHTVDQLYHCGLRVAIRVAEGSTTLKLRASRTATQLCPTVFELRAPLVSDRDLVIKPLNYDFPLPGGAKMVIGGGWYTRFSPLARGQDVGLMMSRRGHLGFQVPAPGRYELWIPYDRVWQQYPQPRLTLNGEDIPFEINRDEPLARIVVRQEFALLNLLSLTLEGPILSEFSEIGGLKYPSCDQTFYAYSIWPMRVKLRKLD